MTWSKPKRIVGAWRHEVIVEPEYQRSGHGAAEQKQSGPLQADPEQDHRDERAGKDDQRNERGLPRIWLDVEVAMTRPMDYKGSQVDQHDQRAGNPGARKTNCPLPMLVEA